MKGSLTLIGSGPGDLSLLPDMAQRGIKAADVVIGYALYLDLLRPLLADKEVISGNLTEEEKRASLAVDKSLEGHNVALISSGDIGIYGLASLVFEIVEKRGADIDVWVVPGISALNSASALLGAPLNHDFCAISLSDLLTPWPLIERRIEAAGAADFNVVFYNPKSEKRDWQLRRAVEILLQFRSARTPVGLVRNAFRKDQDIRHITLGELADAPVDMITTVVIGNSTTRRWKNWMFTPRGYCAGALAEPTMETVAGEESSQDVGDAITQESFRIIQKELGPQSFTPEELAVVTRVIHATADFSFASLLRFQNNFFEAVFQALQSGQPIVTDVEMTRLGIGKTLLRECGNEVLCFLNDTEVRDEAAKLGLTRSAYALRKALQIHPQAIFVIGNAPTALLELIAMTSEGKAKPSAVIGVPVGFVSVAQSKEALLQSSLPACTVLGRRGGSPVASAVMNACLTRMKNKAPVG